MSAFGGKADVFQGVAKSPLLAISGHQDGGSGRHYDLYEYDEEKHGALDAWANRLRVIIAGKEPKNVVELTG